MTSSIPCVRCGFIFLGGEARPEGAPAAPPAPWRCPRCREPRSDEPALIDGRYRVESEIGRGGMGIVYLATDVGLRRQAALKVISPELGEDPAWVQALQDEAVALAAIRNQHVVQVYAFGLLGSSCFFAMEYVRGRTLREIMAEHAAHGAEVPLHRALTILARLAEGIDAVHAAGIVHRDLKPENVVIEEDTGRPVLVDFGLAVTNPSDPWAMSGGTPLYMAPEQTKQSPYGPGVTRRTDVYSFACVAFELLAGQPPFNAQSVDRLIADHARTPAPRLSSIRPDRAALAPLDAAFARALAKEPAARHESCAAFAQALAAAAPAGAEAREAAPPSTRILPEEEGVRRVLVVDDDPAFRRFAERAVQLAFYGAQRRRLQLSAAGSGAEAIARAWQRPPDLVLLDFDMPGLDGVGTLSRLRALPRGEKARVVVLSGKLGSMDRWRFSVLGVNDFVAKPVDLEQLIDAITGIAERAGWTEGGDAAPAP